MPAPTLFSSRKLSMIALLLFLYACQKNPAFTENQVPDISILNYDTTLRKVNDQWLYKGALYSGYMIEIEKNKQLVYKLPILEGKENGLARGWYHSGEKLLERHFSKGKKEGLFTQWWPNGNYRYRFHFKNDYFNGTQQVFFANGNKREESNYQMGNKEGGQRIWNEAGQLISNYTIRNKKLYGVITLKSCIPVIH